MSTSSTRAGQTLIPPETVQQVRQSYRDGKPVLEIAAASELSAHLVYRCLDGTLPERLPPIPRRNRRVSPRRRTAAAERNALVNRLWSAARQQVEEVEQRLARSDQPPSERDARTFAILVKTLRELTVLDQARLEQNPKDAARNDDDAIPLDVDELRRELARRIENIRRRRTAGGAGGPAAEET